MTQGITRGIFLGDLCLPGWRFAYLRDVELYTSKKALSRYSNGSPYEVSSVAGGLSRFALGLLLLLLLLANTSLAIDRADFRINDDIGPAPQTSPQIAVQANGEFFVVWADRRTGLNDLYFQRFNAFGNALESNSVLTSNDSTGSERFQVSIAASISGAYTAVWKDFRNGSFPFNPDIYHTFFDSSGQPSGIEFNRTSLSPDSIFESPDVALGSDGSGVVVWAEHRNGNWDIVAQRFDPNGASIGTQFIVNDDGVAGQQHSPAVSISTLGWFVICWYDNRAGNDDVYFQVYNASGAPVGGNVRAHAKLDSRQAFPDVACDGSGKFTLCWVDWRNGVYPQNPDIFTRRFGSDAIAIDKSRPAYQDLSARPQRDPSIATDRLGNVIIVWADSSANDWNIRGQVIDQQGQFVDTAIQINTDTTSGRQAQPVVAMDGFDIRVAWTDFRNGDFDIYGRIMNYNQPALIVSPSSIELKMHITGPAPAPVKVSLLNAGIGNLGFEIVDTVSWLAVSATSGVAPGSVELSVTATAGSAQLAPGSYFASLPIIDWTNNDSSNAINVTLVVTTSQFEFALESDTLVALAQLGTPAISQLIVNNSGTGTLNWSASVLDPQLSPWLSISAASGSDDDTITITADPNGLAFGFYDGQIVFTDPAASNSPDTLDITLRYASDVPYIVFSPDTVEVEALTNGSSMTGVRVLNAGGNTLQWTAATSLSWVTLQSDAGNGGDSLLFDLNIENLLPGSYSASITVTDSAALNSPLALPVILNIASADTLYFSDYTAALGEQVELDITIGLHDMLSGIHIPLVLDTSLFSFDTVYSLAEDYSAGHSLNWTYDSLSGNLDIDFAATADSVEMFPQGSVSLLRVVLTPANYEFSIPTSDVLRDDDTLVFLYQGGRTFQPQIEHGQLTVGIITDVADDGHALLPHLMSVSQNYPNPFNAETRFDVVLPKASDLRVRIYNVLGQTVKTLYSAYASPGELEFRWDGRISEGLEAPSGIYFYEVKTSYSRIVRKALLLK